MKKITGVMMALFLLCPVLGWSSTQYAPTVINMMPTKGGWVPAGSGGATTMVRDVPTTIRVGTVTRVLNARLTPTAISLGLLSAGMLYDAIKAEPNLFPETKAYLQTIGIDMGIQTNEYTYPGHERVTPKLGTPLDTCYELAKAQRWQGFDDIEGYATYAEKDVRHNEMIFNATTQKCYGSTGASFTCPDGGGDLWYYKMEKVSKPGQPMTDWNAQFCDFKVRRILWNPPSTTPPDQMNKQWFDGSPIPVKQVQDDVKNKLMTDPNNVPEGLRKAIDEMLNKLADALRQNTTMLDKNADETTKLRERLGEVLRQGIGDPALTQLTTDGTPTTPGQDLTEQTKDGNSTETATGDPAQPSGSGSGPVCGAPPLPPCDVTGNWNDVTSTPSDISQTGINEDENTQILGTAESQTTALDEQKGILEGIMQDLWDAINVLVGRIMAEINRFIGENPSGSCSITGAGVFGGKGNFNLSVCDIDFSGWRDCLIAAFGIISAFTLISKW